MSDPAPDVPIFSERLSTALDNMIKGEAPNAGRFCGYCYTPMGPERVTCANCAKAVADYAPVEKVPSEVIAMFRQMRRRESLIVNSFAQFGIFVGVMSFIALFYVFFLNDVAIWWYALDVLLLFVLSPVLAGIIGGYFGDHYGYRFARRKLAEDWRVYEASRAQQQS
jgi:hypothetical protein